MLKKNISYVDYDGVKREEVCYFNLNKAEIAEMELVTEGGLKAYLEKIVEERDAKKIVETFKELIIKSYGVKSEDGRRFIKTDKLREEFVQTEAYSELFVELATDADAAAAFVNGIIPQV